MSFALLRRLLPVALSVFWISAAKAQLEADGKPDAQASAAAPACSDDDVKDGCGTYKFSDGTEYFGSFRGGFFDGPGVVNFANGAILKMNFRNGSGGSTEATYSEPDGTKLSGAFRDVSRDVDHPNPQISYPFWRGLFGDHATLFVIAIVNEDGSVSDVQVYKKIDSESYMKAAVEGVKKWHFLPATISGHPIRMPYIVEIDFSQPG